MCVYFNMQLSHNTPEYINIVKGKLTLLEFTESKHSGWLPKMSEKMSISFIYLFTECNSGISINTNNFNRKPVKILSSREQENEKFS